MPAHLPTYLPRPTHQPLFTMHFQLPTPSPNPVFQTSHNPTINTHTDSLQHHHPSRLPAYLPFTNSYLIMHSHSPLTKIDSQPHLPQPRKFQNLHNNFLPSPSLSLTTSGTTTAAAGRQEQTRERPRLGVMMG